MRFRPYIKGDIFETVNIRFASRYGLPEVPDSDLQTSWTVLDDNSMIIGCGGFRLHWPGVFEAWLSSKTYKDFYANRFQAYRFIRTRIEKLEARRIQATIVTDQPTHVNLIRHLGFKYEATMRKYGPDGKDYYLFALIK